MNLYSLYSRMKLGAFFLILLAAQNLFFSLAFADEIPYDSGNRRDPFIPLIGPGAAVPKQHYGDFRIEGIVIDPNGGSLALINGEFYRQGDQIGEASIISIFNDRVILQQNDEKKTLWIREEILPGGEKKNENVASVHQPKKKS